MNPLLERTYGDPMSTLYIDAEEPASGGDTTIYVEQDFTATTSGDFSTVDPSTDELGNGWARNETIFQFESDGSGVQCKSGSGNRQDVVETDGREDVQLTMTVVLTRGSADTRWQFIRGRSTSTNGGNGLILRFDGIGSDPDLVLIDGFPTGTVLKTWDLSALLTTQPTDGDTATIVVRFSGDDVVLYSIQVNGGTVEIIDDSYTLTGSAATNHGAGSGADFYGIGSEERSSSSSERFEYFKVESIPA